MVSIKRKQACHVDVCPLALGRGAEKKDVNSGIRLGAVVTAGLLAYLTLLLM